MKKIDVLNSNMRVDTFLVLHSSLTRSNIQKMIKNKLVRNNGELITKQSQKVKSGFIEYEELIKEQNLQPEEMPLEIIYEDESIAVINKPAGLIAHATASKRDGTLVNALLFHLKKLSNLENRPGIVHRLDKNTSGLMVIAKNDQAHIFLAEQFKERTVNKKYYAIVSSLRLSSRRLKTCIERSKTNRKKMVVSYNGKEAITEYNLILKKEKYLLDVKIETGRTHQIRVHLASVGSPVLGDDLYGRKENYERHFLHCYFLSFIHPTKKNVLEFKTEIPEEFLKVLEDK